MRQFKPNLGITRKSCGKKRLKWFQSPKGEWMLMDRKVRHFCKPLKDSGTAGATVIKVISWRSKKQSS